MRKAQSSIETLAIGGAAICIIAIMFFFMAKSNPQPVIDTKNSLLTLDDLSKAAERIYQQGVGSKTQILVSLPNDAKMVSFSQRKIIITYNSGKTQQRSVDFEVYGTINSTKGMQKIPVESFEKGVCFGDINTCAQCGNNIIEGSEQCEGLNLNGLTCRDFGYDRGNLGCSACNYNMSACVPAVCGNNLKEVGEECDGFDLANETCYTQGWWSGPLSCQNCIINDSSCKIAQSVCLGIDINEITLDAADNRIHGFEATNLCNFTIYIRGANVSWNTTTTLEAVQLDGSSKWTFNCNWGCTPSGRQPSGTAVYFSGSNSLIYSLPSYATVAFDKMDWKDSVQGIPIKLKFILNDSSYNESVWFSAIN